MDQDGFCMVRLAVVKPWLFNWKSLVDGTEDYLDDRRWLILLEDSGLLPRTCSDPSHRKPSETALSNTDFETVLMICTVVKILSETYMDSEKETQMKHLYQQMGKDNINWEIVVNICKNYPFMREWQAQTRSSNPMLFLVIAYVSCKYTLTKKLGRYAVERFIRTQIESEKVAILRTHGNEQYKNKDYERAISHYTSALEEAPYHFKLYSNRAQAYLNISKNREAATDGFRCVTINPQWDKGWHRYAQGLYNLGMREDALNIYTIGCEHCPNDPCLLTHREKLLVELRCSRPTSDHAVSPTLLKKMKSRKKSTAEKEPLDVPPLVSTDEEEEDQMEEKSKRWRDTLKEAALDIQRKSNTEAGRIAQRKEEELRQISDIRKKLAEEDVRKKVQETLKDHQEKKREKDRMKWEIEENRKREERKRELDKKQEKLKETVFPVKRQPKTHVENPKVTMEIKRLLMEGSEALLDLRSRNAISCYEKALARINPEILPDLQYTDTEMAIVKYALGIAYLETGSEKEVECSLKQFKEILSTFKEMKFPLAWLGVGMAYCRWNRYSEANQALTKGMRIQVKIHFGVHTWPELQTCIKETRPGKLREAFEKYLLLSRHPPRPNAVCRYKNCSGHFKISIYFSDPDFKGFVRIRCFSNCTIEYHLDCWRKFRTESKLSAKEVVVGPCFTPDCWSTCKQIEEIDHNGEVSKKVLGNPPANQRKPQKQPSKMTPSSKYTINRRKERKEHRKQRRLEAKREKEYQENIKVIEDQQKATQKEEEAAAASVAPPISIDECVVLVKKEEEDDEAHKSAKHKKKKRPRDKPAKGMSLEEFQGRNTEENGSQGGFQDDESYLMSSPGNYGVLDDFVDYRQVLPILDPSSPFAIPKNIHSEVMEFEGQFNGAATYQPVAKEMPSSYAAAAKAEVPEEDVGNHDNEEENQQAIRESLFTIYTKILKEHGPLLLEDDRIMSVVRDLPAETCKVVEDIGGIGHFLIQSLNFAMIDEVIGLTKDAAKARKVANKRKLMLRRSGTDSPSRRHKNSVTSMLSTISYAPSLFNGTRAASTYRGSTGSETDLCLSSKNTGAHNNGPRVNDDSSAPGLKVFESLLCQDGDSDRESVVTSGSEFLDYKSDTGKRSSNDLNLGFTAAWDGSRRSSDSEAGKDALFRNGYSGDGACMANRSSPSVSLPQSGGSCDSPKHSRWQVPLDPAVMMNGFKELVGDSRTADRNHSPDAPEKMSSEEILNCFRLSANRLVSAVELGKLAMRTEITLSLEVHFMEGWRLEEGLEEADTATQEEALALLQDAITIVHSNSLRNYNALGADIYFFGTGSSSGEDWSTWIKSPEVPCNSRIVIAMFLEHVDLSKVNFEQLDHTTAETLMALKNAVSVITTTTDRFRGSNNIRRAVEPILSVIGRKVAADNPETKALLRCKPSAKLPLGLTLSSSVVSAPGRVNSPIARPSSSVSSSPLPSTPTHHLNSPLSLSASSSPGPLPFPSLTKPPIVNLAATLCSLSHQQQLQQSSDFVRECVSDDFDRKVAAQMQGYAKDNSQVASACQQDLCGIQERLKQEKEESDQVRNERDVYQIQVSDLQIQLQTLQGEKALLKHENRQLEQSCAALTSESEACIANQTEQICQMSARLAESDQALVELLQQVELEREQMNEERRCHQEALLVHQNMLDEERQRAEAAEKLLLRLKLDVGMQIVDRSLVEAEGQIMRIQQQRGMYRDNQLTIPKELSVAINAWQDTLEKIKDVRATALANFQEQIFKVGQGERLENLPPLDIPCPPSAPDLPPPQSVSQLAMSSASSTSSRSSGTPPLGDAPNNPKVAPPIGGAKVKTAASVVASGITGAPPGFGVPVWHAPAVVNSAPRTSAKRPPGFGVTTSSRGSYSGKNRNSFEKIIEVLLPKYLDFTRVEISSYIQDLRKSRKGSLSGMSMMDVLNAVESCMLQEQEGRRQQAESVGMSAWSMGGTARHAAGSYDTGSRDVFTEEEDPCTICLEELSAHPTTELSCLHRFHDGCIRQWLSEKSTCPICNKYALLMDEFPTLS